MPSDKLVEDIVRLMRTLRQMTHPVRRGEITQQQFWLLRQLDREGPLSIGDLADMLGVSPSTATIACKRLEKAGLVTRERQTDDERVVQVGLTAAGTEQVAAWRRRYRETLAELLTPLNRAERDELQRLIERVLDEASLPAGSVRE